MKEINVRKEKLKSFIGGAVTALLLVFAALLIYGIILSREERKFVSRFQGSGYSDFEVDTESTGALVSEEFINKAEMIYSGVVQEFYFDEDIDTGKMHDEMYKAIINSLGDKYAEYYTAEEYAELMSDSEGTYYGIGSYVQLDEETGYPMLSGVFEDSPAERAGLRDGDIITEVFGESLFGCTLNEAVALIKGPENTEVELTVYRAGEPEYLHITVIRGKVDSPTVKTDIKEGDIGYLQITEFDDVTSAQFNVGYDNLRGKGIKGLVIDLRSNGGGNLSTVLEIAERMLPEGIITYTVDKGNNREEFKCAGKTPIDIPVVILTNGYTASASELLTGAMHDYGLATVIGTNTFGKGIVQTIYPFRDGSGIKITTSRYYTPLGKCIHEVGIAPDIELEFDGEAYYSEKSFDNQLDYAVKYLQDKIE